MRLDILLQFIVPLTFLAIWALTSLLNREAQPLPPRPGRSPVPGGPRPGMGAPMAGRGDPVGPIAIRDRRPACDAGCRAAGPGPMVRDVGPGSARRRRAGRRV